MQKSMLGSLATLVAFAGLAFPQTPPACTEPVTTVVVCPPSPAPAAEDCGEGKYNPHCWVNADYLAWWVKRAPAPSNFVTTGSAADMNPGALGQPGTGLVAGGHLSDFGAFSGARLTAGAWFDPDQCYGFEASGFVLEKRSRSFQANSDPTGNPVVAFRHLDPPPAPDAPFPEDAFQAAIPGTYSGGLGILATNRLWGADAHLVFNCPFEGCFSLQLLTGVRYLDLRENFDLQFQRFAIGSTPVSFLGNPFPAPAMVSATDMFHAGNQFFGGQIGISGDFSIGRCFLGFDGKLGLGSNHEVVSVAGNSTLSNPGSPPVTVPTGLFAAPSNIGRSVRDEFAFVPEVEVKLGYQVSRFLLVYVGYDFLYMSRVVRPGSQLDLVVDTKQVAIDPGFSAAAGPLTFPRSMFNRSDFWAQGIDVGLELQF